MTSVQLQHFRVRTDNCIKNRIFQNNQKLHSQNPFEVDMERKCLTTKSMFNTWLSVARASHFLSAGKHFRLWKIDFLAR